MTTPTPNDHWHGKFTLFPNLPPELRLQIYRHACHPRITTLAHQASPTPSTFPNTTFHCLTPPPALLHVSREARAEGLRFYVRCWFPCSVSSSRSSSVAAAVDSQGQPGSGYREKKGEGSDGDGDGNEITRQDGEVAEERYFYHHPLHDTLYLPRPGGSSDACGLGYAGWAREFAGRLPALANAVRRLAVDYVPGDVRRPWEVFGKMCLMRGCPLLEEAYLVIGSVCRSEEQGGEEERTKVEFVDPRADDGEIIRIMERVRASFRYELGDDGVGHLGLRKGGFLEMGGDRERLELIPKVVCDWGCRRAVCAT